MDLERFERIILVLERDELTLRERKFVEAVKKQVDENGRVTDQQESLLEGIYREKVWMRKTFLGQNGLP